MYSVHFSTRQPFADPEVEFILENKGVNHRVAGSVRPFARDFLVRVAEMFEVISSVFFNK